MVVPSWQQIPPQHAAIQQPLLSDAGDWGRPLIVDSSTILQVFLIYIGGITMQMNVCLEDEGSAFL
jgi:hypothetical protein